LNLHERERVMKSVILALTASAMLLLCACAGTESISSTEDAAKRIKWFRVEASGYRKDAMEQQVLMDITRKKIEESMIGLDALYGRLVEVESRIAAFGPPEEVREPEKRIAYQRAVGTYMRRKDAVLISIEGQKSRILGLHEDYARQRAIHDALTQKADLKEQEAQRIEIMMKEMAK
jgi:hypothetical protein